MIDLYAYKSFNGLPFESLSMRLEAFLNASQIPFQVIEDTDYIKALERQLPSIRDNQIQVVGDQLIIDYLQKKMDFEFDNHLDEKTKAIHFAFDNLLTEHFYPILLASLWFEEANVAALKNMFFKDIPPPIANLKIKKIQKHIKQSFVSKGHRQLELKNLYRQGVQSIYHLNTYLDERQWFGGLFLSKLDLTVVSFLRPLVMSQFSSPLIDALKTYPRLETYLVRATHLLFSERIESNQRQKTH